MANSKTKETEKNLEKTDEKTKALAGLELSAADQAAMYGELTQEHVTIPRLSVIELLSPEFKEQLGKTGDFFVKGANINLGKEPLEIVVLMRSNSRMRWKPMNEGGGIICQSRDGKKGVGEPGGDCSKCSLKDWQGSNKPQCDGYENFIVVLRKDLQNGEPMPMAISGSRTRLKGLKDFNTMLMLSIQKRRPLFYKSYVIQTVHKVNGQNDWHIFRFSPGNNNAPLPEAEQLAAMQLFKAYSNMNIDIQQDREDGPSATGGVETPAF